MCPDTELPNDHAAQDIHTLISQLGSSDATTSAEAITALISIGSPAVPALVSALQQETAWYNASEVLAQIGQPAVGLLIQALDNANIDSFAADIIAKVGSPAIPSLIATLPKANVAVKAWIAQILGWIGDPSARSPLLQLRNDPDREVKQFAAEALKRIP